MDKDKVENMCREAGMKPVKRSSLGGYDLLIAEGFSLPPHKAFRRFGVEDRDFNSGCYVTMWWLMKGEDNMAYGHPLMFDVFHDPEYDPSSRKQMRVNSALDDARNFLEMKKKVN